MDSNIVENTEDDNSNDNNNEENGENDLLKYDPLSPTKSSAVAAARAEDIVIEEGGRDLKRKRKREEKDIENIENVDEKEKKIEMDAAVGEDDDESNGGDGDDNNEKEGGREENVDDEEDKEDKEKEKEFAGNNPNLFYWAKRDSWGNLEWPVKEITRNDPGYSDRLLETGSQIHLGQRLVVFLPYNNKIDNLESYICSSSDLLPFIVDDDNYKKYSKLKSRNKKQKRRLPKLEKAINFAKRLQLLSASTSASASSFENTDKLSRAETLDSIPPLPLPKVSTITSINSDQDNNNNDNDDNNNDDGNGNNNKPNKRRRNVITNYVQTIIVENEGLSVGDNILYWNRENVEVPALVVKIIEGRSTRNSERRSVVEIDPYYPLSEATWIQKYDIDDDDKNTDSKYKRMMLKDFILHNGVIEEEKIKAIEKAHQEEMRLSLENTKQKIFNFQSQLEQQQEQQQEQQPSTSISSS
jgi:hypothetical protein